MFFVFDGVDGAGKSTQLEMFVQWLAEQGHDVVTCSDPGSTELGEQIRAILLGKHETPISMQAEMMSTRPGPETATRKSAFQVSQ